MGSFGLKITVGPDAQPETVDETPESTPEPEVSTEPDQPSQYGLAITVEPPKDEPGFLSRAATAVKRAFTPTETQVPPDLSSPYPARVPPQPAPPAPIDPDLARARRAAQHLRIEDLVPSQKPEYAVEVPKATELPETVSQVQKPQKAEPTSIWERLGVTDPEHAAAAAADAIFQSKSVMNRPELDTEASRQAYLKRVRGPEPSANDANLLAMRDADAYPLETDFWGQAIRVIQRSVGGAVAQYTNEQLAGGLRAFEHGWDRVMEPESVIEMVAQGLGQAAGFVTGAPIKMARSIMAGALGSRMAAHAAPQIGKLLSREGTVALVKATASEAANLGIASALAHTAEYGMEPTLEQAYYAMGQHVQGGAEMGAIFGALGTSMPGGWTSFRELMASIREGGPQLQQRALMTAARIGVGSTAMVANEAAHGTLRTDNIAQMTYDFALNAYFLALSGHGALERVEQDGRARGLSPLEALREIRVRRIGDQIVIEKLTAPTQEGQDPTYQRIGAVDATTMRTPADDYTAGLADILGHEPKTAAERPVEAPQESADYSAGLDEIFGESGSRLGQAVAEAKGRLAGEAGGDLEDISRRGVDIRGSFGEGFERNRMLMNDLATAGAAHLWRGDRSFRRWSDAMVTEYGEPVRPQLERLYRMSQKALDGLVDIAPDRLPTVSQVLGLLHAGQKATPSSHGLSPALWYDKAEPEIRRMFGRNAELYSRVLASLSPHSSVIGNITMANRAMKLILTGERSLERPFTPGSKKDGGDGYMEAHANNLNRVLRGEPLEGPKVEPFARALMGDRHAIVVDTWMLRAFGLGEETSDAKVRFVQGAVARWGRELGMDERQVQAAIWAGVKRKVEGKTVPLPPIDRAIQARLDQIAPWLLDMEDSHPAIARRLAEGQDPMVDRLSGVVQRGKAAGIAPEQMFKDFTTRGAAPDLARVAIQRHFPGFQGEPNAPATQVSTARPSAAPEVPQARTAQGAPAPEAGARPGPTVAPSSQPGRVQAKAPTARPELRGAVPGGAGAGQPSAPGAAESRAPAAHISGQPGEPALESRLRTVYPRGGQAVEPDARLQSHLAILKPHQIEDASRILKGLDSPNGSYGLFNGAGPQPLDALVLTPTGWIKMGDIFPGDYVVAQDGTPTMVLDVLPQGEKPVYRIRFSDGATTESCDQHLWAVESHKDRTHHRGYRVVELGDIRAALHEGWTIPLVEPIEFQAQPVPLDPYLLGVLLGDGCMTQGVKFTTADQEIVDEVRRRLPADITLTVLTHPTTKCPSYSFRRTSGRVGRGVQNPVVAGIKTLGIMGCRSWEKRVPDVYLWNSATVRLELLRGLMDTDGTVSGTGVSVTFSSTSRAIVDSVVFLVRSLGGVCGAQTSRYTHYTGADGQKRTGRQSWTVSLAMPPEICPFRLPRKVNRTTPKSKYRPRRYIVNVEAVGPKPVQCIRIAHPGALYVTDDFIVTHNSGKTYVVLAALDAMRRQGVPVYYVSPASVLQIDPKTKQMSGTLKEASERLGVPVKLFTGVGRPQGDAVHVMSYEKFKKLEPDQRVVIAFDESHYLKNVETGLVGSRADRGAEWMKAARGVILATATPLDKATHIPYLERLGVFEGKTKEQAMADLGLVRQQAPTGQIFWRALDEGVTATRIEALFERLAASGQISAREIHMEGIPVSIKQVPIDKPAVDRMVANILRGYGVESVDEIRGIYKAVALESMRRQLEPYKIEPAVSLAKQELAEGRQVVLYVSRINYSAARTPKKLGRKIVAQSEGTAKTLKERLAQEGIQDVAELHGNSEQERAQAVAAFQDGKARVLIATPESGAAGINLDDQVGNRPRSTIMITAPYGATENVQATGRTWRLNTKSDPRYFYLDSGEAIDSRNLRIVAAKLRTLGAVVQSEVARKLESPDISRRPAIEYDYKGWVTPEGENKLHEPDVAHSNALKRLGYTDGESAAIEQGWVRHFRIDKPSEAQYQPWIALDLNPRNEKAVEHARNYLERYGTPRHEVTLDMQTGGGGSRSFDKIRDAIKFLKDYGNGEPPKLEASLSTSGQYGEIWLVRDLRYPSGGAIARFNNEQSARAWVEAQQPPDISRRGAAVAWNVSDQIPDFPGRGEPGERISKPQMADITQLEPTEKADPKAVAAIARAMRNGEPLPAIVVNFSAKSTDARDVLDVVDGHARLQAAQRLGMTEVPVRIAVDSDFEGSLKLRRTADEEARGAFLWSPNTEGSLPFDQALARLSSEQHAKAIEIARDIDRHAGLQATSLSVAGDTQQWGAENSVVDTAYGTPEAIRYGAVLRGRVFGQEAALAFVEDPVGPDALYSFVLPRGMDEARRLLDTYGLHDRSIVSEGDGTRVIIYDQGGQLPDKIGALADAVGVIEIDRKKGRGELIGQADYAAAEAQHEATHPGRYGSRTWSDYLESQARRGSDREGRAGHEAEGSAPEVDIVRRTAEVERERKAAVDHPAFRRWFGRSRVTDEDGRPVIVYHGTTHDFGEFGPERSHIENDLGSGYYFTSEPEDAGRNYAGIGKRRGGGVEQRGIGGDLDQRISSRAEQIEQDLGDEMGEVARSQQRDAIWKKAYRMAKAELFGGQPNVMPVYLRLQNPIEIQQRGGTRFTVHYNESTGYESGNGLKLYEAINRVGAELGFDARMVWAEVSENGLDGTPAYDIYRTLRESVELGGATDESGNLIRGEATRRIFQEMGYDGIILRDADQQYQNMGMEPGTTHYVAFRPNQIKSAIGNRGTWSLRSGDITRRANVGEDLFREPGQLSPRFYSNVERVIQARVPNVGSGEQVWNTLKNTPGVKAEELKWLGLTEQFLKGKPKWTKDELLAFVRAHDLEPDITMIGGPTPTGQTADVQKLQDRVEITEGDRIRADEALAEYRTFVTSTLQERLERQNEIAKARGKKKRNIPKIQVALPGMGDESSSLGLAQFPGQPGAVTLPERPRYIVREGRSGWDVVNGQTGAPRMTGFSSEQTAENYREALGHTDDQNRNYPAGEARRDLGPATWTIDQGEWGSYGYSNRNAYDYVVRRNGEVVFRANSSSDTDTNKADAKAFVEEQKRLELERRAGGPKPPPRWRVNPVVTAKKMLAALVDEANENARDPETVGLRAQAEFLLKPSGIRQEAVVAELNRLTGRLSEAQTRADEATRALGNASRDLPSTHYEKYTLPGGAQYFEVGFRKKPDPGNQTLANRIAEIEHAMSELAQSALPTELPDGYTVREVPAGETLFRWIPDPNGDIEVRAQASGDLDRYVGSIERNPVPVPTPEGQPEVVPGSYQARMARRFEGEGPQAVSPIYRGEQALDQAKQWVAEKASRLMSGLAYDTFEVLDPNGLVMSSGYRDREGAIVAFQDSVKNGRHDVLAEELRKAKNSLRNGPSSRVDFTSGHFGGEFRKNLLFHVRGKIRRDSEGRQMLALEELQSDWNIAGRTKGWAQPLVTELPAGYTIKKIEHPRVEGTASSAQDDALLRRLAGRNTDEYPWAVISRDPEVRIKLFRSQDSANQAVEGERGDYEKYWGGRVVDTRTLSGTPTVEGYTEYQVMAPVSSRDPWLTGFRSSEDARSHALDTLNHNYAEGVADAPFVKGLWQEAAMKWALRYAAEQGYDGVVWTTGKQQADRYNLAKLIDEITYFKLDRTASNPEVTYNLTGYKDGSSKFEESIAEKDLPGFIGAELAKKIIADEGKRDKEMPAKLSGLDLELGGESHKALYDRQIPSFMNRYTKQWGGKVQDFDMGERPRPRVETNPRTGRTVAEIDRAIDELQEQRQTPETVAALNTLHAERDAVRFPGAQPGWIGSGALDEGAATGGPVMHGVLITPEMRKSVLGEGQPLFRGEKGEITGPMIDAALHPDRAVPIEGTRIPVIDTGAIHDSALVRQIAGRQYMGDLVPVLERVTDQIAQAMAPKGAEFGRARLHAIDLYIEEPSGTMTMAYNRTGRDQIFLNLHAHVLAQTDRGSLDTSDLAEDLSKSLVWEILRQRHNGPGLTDKMMDAYTKAAIKGLRERGIDYDGFVQQIHNALEVDSEHVSTAIADARAVDRLQREADAVQGGAQAPVEPGAGGIVRSGEPGHRAPPPAVGAALERGGGGAATGRSGVLPEAVRPVAGQPPEGVRPVPPVVPELAQLPQSAAAGSAPAVRGGGPGRPATEAASRATVGPAPGAQEAATRAAIEYFQTATAPPPPYTLGGGTVTRPHQANVLARLRKDRIIQDFGQALRDLGKGGLVLQGGLQNKRALGQSHRQSGNVRLKSITDVDTAAHEFGHRLQDALGVRPQDLVPFTGELGALTAYGRVQGPTVPEGWAEFWRMHAADPVNAARLAPGLYQWAEARLRGEPPLDAAWQALRSQIMELRGQSPIDRMKSAIAFPEAGPSLPQQVKETIAVGHLRSMLRANIFAYFDQTLPFRLVSEAAEATRGAPLPASRDPFKWSRTLSPRVIDALNGFRKEGVMDWATRRPVPGSQSFEAIVRAVAGHQQDFQVYEVLRRAQFLAQSTKPDGTPNEIHRSTAAHLMRLADIDPAARDQAVRDLEGQYPNFKGTLDSLQGWNSGLLKWMEDSGAYSPAAIQAIEQANDLYVPLHRLMDQPKDLTAGSGESSVNVGRAIKRLGGRSERLILPTLQTRIRQAMLMIGTAERNYAGQILFDAVKQIPNYGTWADKIPIPARPSAFQLADVKGALKTAFQKSGQDPRILDQVDLNTLATIFQPNYRDLPANQVVVWRAGEPEVWQIHDPLLLRAATHMGPNESRSFGAAMGLVGSMLYRMARIPARGVQFSVVHGIDFLVGHVVRSAQEQGLQGYMVPPVLSGMKDVLGRGRAQERYLAGGGRVFNFEDYSPEGIQRTLNSLAYTTKNPFNLDYWREGGVTRPWRDFLNVLDLTARLFDEPARVGVAKLAYDHPRAVDTTELDRVVEAAFRGRESGLDFGQRGASDLFNRYLSLVPFSHAVAVGLYRNLRNYRQAGKALSNEGLAAVYRSPDGAPERRYARGLVIYGGVMLLSSLYSAWANQNDPRYQALSDQEKTGYFHFLPPWSRRFSAEEWQAMTPDEQVQYGSPYIKISKPWWPGFFQATLPAEILEGVVKEDQTLTSTLSKIWTSFLQSSRIEVLPTVARIPLELKLNRRQLLDLSASPRPITPDFQMKLEAEKRYGPDTPEVAKQLAAALRAVPGFSDMGPRDVQYLISSFGYLPQYGASNAEWVTRVFGGKDLPEPPATRWYEMPGVQRFVQRFPNSHPEVVIELDGLYREAAKIAATYKVKQQDGDPDIQGYREKHRFEIGAAPMLAFWAQHMKQTWKQVDRVKANKTLTPEEKRQRIDLLYLDVLDQSNRYMSRVNEMKKAAQNP